MTSPRATRTVAVWCPDWPIVAAGVDDGVPAAVIFANRVVACSAPARDEGVRRGLRRREAQGRCPDLVVIEHDPSRDARAFEPVVASLDAICPRVEIVRPGVCVFAARGPSRYFGGDEAVASATVEVTRGRVGIADGAFAALLAARTGDRWRVVPQGESRTFLAPLPIRSLDRPELGDLLARLGLRTLGAFAALPPAQVLARFGPDGADAHRLCRGLDLRPLAARTPPPDLTVASEIDPPTDRVDQAAFVAKALADRLHEGLGRAGLACTRILIEAETEHGETMSRLWRHDGALTAAAVAERVRWQLDGWLNAGRWSDRPTAGIALVRLAPDEVRPDHGRQLGFWGGSTLNDERAARALARVQGMLGVEAVRVPVVQGGRSPAERIRLVPWGDAREPGRDTAPPWPGQVPPPAPALVHDPPLTAAVAAHDGQPVAVTGRGMCSAPPATVSVDGGPPVAVTGWAGPWPVDERWWDGSAHRRRARFQVAARDGSARLLAVEGSRWWVEATYD